MDEKDKEIQELRRVIDRMAVENDALMGELYGLKECSTCIHNDKRETECDGISHMFCPKDKEYTWRGVKGYREWQIRQAKLKMLEEEVKADAIANGYIDEG